MTPLWGPIAGFGDVGSAADLPETSRERVERLSRSRDRRDTEVAHLLARRWVRRLDPEAEIEQRCPECEAVGHGRPEVPGRPDLGVSWSHSNGFVAVLVTSGPCGVDVERVRTAWPQRAFTAAELCWADAQADPAVARTRLWTCKESLVKVGATQLGDVGRVELVAAGQMLDSWAGWRLECEESGDGGAICAWVVPA